MVNALALATKTHIADVPIIRLIIIIIIIIRVQED
jgi:hypothetical protein